MQQNPDAAQLLALADLLEPLLPAPTARAALPSGGYSLVGGAPPLVTLRLTPAGLRVGPASVRPWGKRGVLVEGRLAAAGWGELPADAAGVVAVAAHLVAAAQLVAARHLSAAPSAPADGT